MRCFENPEATLKLVAPNLEPGRITKEVLPSATKGLTTQAENRSLYESLGSAHADVAIEHDCRPMSGTDFVRNLIRAAWEELIYRTESRINADLLLDRFQYGNYRDINAFEQKYIENNRNTQRYHELIQTRVDMQMWRGHLRRTTYAFSMDDIDQRFEPQSPAKLTRTLAQERRSWARLHQKLATIEATISNQMEAFSARAALEGSFAAYRQAEESREQTREANEQTRIANRHARSAGQLTKIATIIVPCTFVASIFSMGGSFAAGEHLFFVYWAISVPITLALLSWVLHGDIKKMWHKWRANQNKEVKQADKMA
jgi:hypothetical protein